MKVRFSFLAVALLSVNFLFAQTMEQGKKYYYYERYSSANQVFEKLVSTNPANTEAIYWLGQTMIAQERKDEAKAVFQKGLQATNNAPLMVVAMGHIELLENKPNEARQKFETAISLSKSKDAFIFAAISKANSDSKFGDATYALDKINEAIKLDKKNPEYFIIKGNAYRKLVDGGNAVLAYREAINLDPKNVRAKFKIGRIYMSQNNPDVFMPIFNEIESIDPDFSPVYYELYYYFYFRDVNKAKVHLDKYLARSDIDMRNEIMDAELSYVSQRYQEAVNKTNAIFTKYGSQTKPRLYKLLAYSYDELGDSLSARSNMEQYFEKADPENIVAKDYELMGKILAKFPDAQEIAFQNFEKALGMEETSMEDKVEIIKTVIDIMKARKDKLGEAVWMGKMYDLKKNPTNLDLYNYAFAYYAAGRFETADSLFGIYTQRFPDEIFGYLWRARSNMAIDTAMTIGLAVPHYEKLIEVASVDPVKNKGVIIQSYGYLAGYHANTLKDYQTAIDLMNKILELDPTNPSALESLEILNKALKASQTKTAPKTKTGGS